MIFIATTTSVSISDPGVAAAAPQSPPLLYGLDIETDTALGGLDPNTVPIVAVALAGDGWSTVIDGDERDILVELERAVASLPAGVLVTWNGGRFDLPFIHDRAARIGVALGLHLSPDTLWRSAHEPLPGHSGGYTGSWHQHRHLDAYRVYRADVGASLGMPCGLKPLSRLLGLTPVEVDRSAIHELTRDELSAYVASDAVLTRELALRRWPTASRAIDRVSGASEPRGQRSGT